jgi:alanyl-tRNA synthetase
VSDSGTVGDARVVDVYRLGDDQVIEIEPAGELAAGAAVSARVDRDTRLATMRNHTATHLLHAALRERLGGHVRQAGSYVGPDKLRFDFTHGERMSDEELADVEAWVADRIADAHRVHAIETTRDEAEALGAMALFGEKYGDWVRMVEIEGVSRELCGGTHVGSTAELGLFHLLSETSSASNVRRIEAVTGRAGTELFRERTGRLRELATLMRVPEPEVVRAVERLSTRVKELQKAPAAQTDGAAADELASGAEELGGVKIVVEATAAPDADSLLQLSDTVRQRLGDAAVLLGTAGDGRVQLVANFAPAVVERGLRADEIVRAAAKIVGGGGGGRDTMAQAGGRDADKLPDALATARLEIERALG